MLTKFQFWLKLQGQPPETMTIRSNCLQTAANTAVLSAQWKLGRKLGLTDPAGFPAAANQPPEHIQLLGIQ